MMNIVFSASALPYFVTKTSASYVSRSKLIQAYLRQEQRTSSRKVPFDQKFHHFLIVLQRRVSATTKPKDFASSLQNGQICFCHTIRYEDDKTVSDKTKRQFCFCFCRTIRYDLTTHRWVVYLRSFTFIYDFLRLFNIAQWAV